MTGRISYFGIGAGAAALLMALIHFWAGPFAPQPELADVVAETAVEIRDATMRALRGEERPAPTPASPLRDIDEIIQVATAVLGGLAVILGVVGLARNEPKRAAGGAAVLGIGAITFQFATWLAAVIVFIVLVGAVLDKLDFGFFDLGG